MIPYSNFPSDRRVGSAEHYAANQYSTRSTVFALRPAGWCWSMLGVLMVAMFGILFGVQKRKDIV